MKDESSFVGTHLSLPPVATCPATNSLVGPSSRAPRAPTPVRGPAWESVGADSFGYHNMSTEGLLAAIAAAK